jgi:hypothetical protein
MRGNVNFYVRKAGLVIQLKPSGEVWIRGELVEKDNELAAAMYRKMTGPNVTINKRAAGESSSLKLADRRGKVILELTPDKDFVLGKRAGPREVYHGLRRWMNLPSKLN